MSAESRTWKKVWKSISPSKILPVIKFEIAPVIFGGVSEQLRQAKTFEASPFMVKVPEDGFK